MYCKTLTYEDFDGNQHTENFYFHLTEADLFDLKFSVYGGIEATLAKLVEQEDTPGMVKFMRELVLRCYGEKSPDGKRFIRTPEVVEAFSQTQAYSDIYMALATDLKEAEAFVNGIMPKKIQEALKANEGQLPDTIQKFKNLEEQRKKSVEKD